MFIRGFYNSAQAMIVKQRELDAIANNIDNVNTSGFRKERVTLNTFQDELIWVQKRKATHSGTFQQTYVDEGHTLLENGGLEFTDSRFDVAIWGDVYFNVTDRNGATFNTRAGQFELDNEGYLTLGSSGRVQGQNGGIFIGHDDFVINTRGEIYTSRIETDENGVPTEIVEYIDRLLLTYIPSDANVRKISNNLFAHDGAGTDVLPDGLSFSIIQGAFEKSNVDPNREVSKMMEIQRLFEANSVILKGFDMINSRTSDMANISG
ncbi:MAG: flagellar hook basal-body protein [Oscillospiraceae bacterium]|nr:flagellar hook basal-body protein [Oscillospiraceae bacterium]